VRSEQDNLTFDFQGCAGSLIAAEPRGKGSYRVITVLLPPANYNYCAVRISDELESF